MRSNRPPHLPTLVTIVGIVLIAGLVGPGSLRADGVWAAGLFELGDGQPPAGMPGVADIVADPNQSGPDWGELFDADGAPRDDHPTDPYGNPVGNGIPDYLELYGGDWAFLVADDVSMGSGPENTALSGGDSIVNAVVQAEHDLGNAFVYSTSDGSRNRILFAASERLGGGDSSLVFEFNQGVFRIGQGGFSLSGPWQIVGTLDAGDVRLEVTFAGGAVSGAIASVWDGEAWLPVSAVEGEGCDLAETLCAVANGATIDNGEWGADPVAANRFVEAGVNVGALLGFQPTYRTVQIRTPQDIAFGYFGEGK